MEMIGGLVINLDKRRLVVRSEDIKRDKNISLTATVEAAADSLSSLAIEVGHGGSSNSSGWLKDYVDRLSNMMSFRSSGMFFTRSSRRSDVVQGGDYDAEANRLGDEIDEMFRWLSTEASLSERYYAYCFMLQKTNPSKFSASKLLKDVEKRLVKIYENDNADYDLFAEDKRKRPGREIEGEKVRNTVGVNFLHRWWVDMSSYLNVTYLEVKRDPTTFNASQATAEPKSPHPISSASSPSSSPSPQNHYTFVGQPSIFKSSPVHT
ncbi:hypothetical protein V8G54_030602 [Vigna mungo]|uniref:Uncharacterized protein n=1 Tax=Vigna mungo TaxID=3915 RepID=A0AAQ3MWN6_VIGMU